LENEPYFYTDFLDLLLMRVLNISDSGLAGVAGFGILQEIFKGTYQRPLIVNKETQAETKSRLRGRIYTGAARISWESASADWRSLNRILAESQSPLPLSDPLIRCYAKVSLYERRT